jgi:tRNA pseudouridine38-40 synthase
MPRYLLKLAYNGTAYHGWQIQVGAHTVQAEINEKLSLLLGEDINVTGCGRTDTGVHAREFYAHFDISVKAEKILKTMDTVYRLNSFLPPDIAVYSIKKVNDDFNARFDAKSRTYKYYISRRKNPFLQNTSYLYTGKLNIAVMQKGAEILLEYDDFTSFSKLHTQTKTNICKIFSAEWQQNDDLLIFTIAADRFLRNMVRAVVGTLLELGKEKINLDDLRTIIEAKDRNRAGFSVPAQGLFLEKVEYEGGEETR